MMVGREVIFEALLKEQRAGDGLFKVEHLNYTDANKRQRLIDINLQVHAGEIVGVAGVEGNGQLELVNVIMGLIEPTSGTIEVQGADITKSSILERRRRIAFVSQDRTNMGSSVNARITENVIMTHHRLNPRFTRWNGRILDLRQADMFTNEVRDRFDVQMTSPEILSNRFPAETSKR